MDAVILQGRGLINVNQKASDKIGDYDVANDTSSKKVHVEDLTMQPPDNNLKMDTFPSEDLCDGKSKRKKIKRQKRKKPILKDEGLSLDRNRIDTLLANNTAVIQKLTNKEEEATSSKTVHEEDLTMQQLDDNLKMDTLSTENLCDGKSKRKKKRKKRRKAKLKDEGLSLDENITDTLLMNNTAEGNAVIKNVGHMKIDTGLKKSFAEVNASVKKPEVRDDHHIFRQIKEDTGSSKDLAEGNATVENTGLLDKVQSKFSSKMDTGAEVNISDKNAAGKRRKKRKRIVKEEIEDEVQNKMDSNGGKAITVEPNYKVEVQDSGPAKIDIRSIENESQSMHQIDLDSELAQSFTLGIAGVKRKKKEKPVDAIQKEMDIGLIESHGEENVTIKKKPEVNDKVQILGQTKMNIGPIESFSDGNVFIENPKDEAQIMDQQKIDILWPQENPAQGNVSGNQRKKRKKTKKAKVNDEVLSEMDTRPTGNLFDGNIVILNPKTQDEDQSMDKMDTCSYAENLSCKVRKKRKKKKFNAEVNSEKHSRSAENLPQGNTPIKMLEIKDEVQSVSRVQMDTRSTENVAQGNVTIKNPKSQDEIQNIYRAKMNTGPTQNFVEVVKRKRKRKKAIKEKILDEVSSRMGAGSTENLARVIVSMRRSETRDEAQSMGLKVMDAESLVSLSQGNVENPKNKDEGQRMDIGPEKDYKREHVNGKRKRKHRSNKNTKNVDESTSQDGDILNFSVNGLCQVGNEITLDEETGHADRRSAISISNAFNLKDTKAISLKTAPIASTRRKLLVLDLNGLLADIIYSAPKHCRGDIKISGRQVFRRPFCDDFLNFCFKNFDVGIWSSRSKNIVDKIVDYLLEDRKDKLQFCWDMTHSTQTGFKTLENCNKPLVCKELRKIWENDDPNCPWKKGDYDESNTLLMDDSPYKALLNPLHTAIFPPPYQYFHRNDNSLGPGGDLRVYLEGLVASENVQKYVEEHPFGQKPITEKNLSWGFYKKVLEQFSDKVKVETLIHS